MRPQGFVEITFTGVVEMISYAGSDNFLGQPVDGYQAAKGILTEQAATALLSAQRLAQTQGYTLVVFDAYRPTQAVQHFLRWATQKPNDPDKEQALQKRFYPELSKQQLFEKGYIAKHSSHTRGSTVDLSLQHQQTGQLLDMGTEFDFFGAASWLNYTHLTPVQLNNRTLLQSIMKEAGFLPFEMEWWHFTLQNEPYPETYFDFPIR